MPSNIYDTGQTDHPAVTALWHQRWMELHRQQQGQPVTSADVWASFGTCPICCRNLTYGTWQGRACHIKHCASRRHERRNGNRNGRDG